MQKNLVLLGSTGSIGTQALQVVRPSGCRVLALSAHRNIQLLEQQARAFSPRYVAIGDSAGYAALKTALADTDIHVLAGPDALLELAALPEAEIVLNAVVGIAGLRPTLAALKAGKTLALANKESLVTGGHIVMELAHNNGGHLLPVDSEHSAIFQALQGNEGNKIREILLTASGGPFFGKSREELADVMPQQALQHPNWSMGAKITIDSATMMNKGLELIEAMWLFGVSPERIRIVIHRESILHSGVEFEDHSLMVQMGLPDMRIPIQYALTWPRRLPGPAGHLSLAGLGRLTFSQPDFETFLCLKTALKAAKLGGLAPCVANGANEEAVRLFLEGKISFLQIGELVAGAVEELAALPGGGVEDVFAADQAAREHILAHFQQKI